MRRVKVEVAPAVICSGVKVTVEPAGAPYTLRVANCVKFGCWLVKVITKVAALP